MTTSVYGAFENQHNTQVTPFSAKKVVHESDTLHPKSHSGSKKKSCNKISILFLFSSDNIEELVITGDKHEMEEFIRSASSSCKTKIEIFLPTISLHLKSKHIYELIYNRINNDLLLWEPSAPKQKVESFETSFSTYPNFDRKLNIPDTFGMCKSGIQYGKQI